MIADRLRNWVHHGWGYHILLVLLFWMILGQAGTQLGEDPSVFGALIRIGVFAVALFAVVENRWVLILGTFLMLPSVIVTILEVSAGWSESLVGQAFGLAFLGLITLTFLSRIFSYDEVRAGTLSAAACVYLFLGIAWGFAYEMVVTLDPGAFSGLEDPGRELVYFSFVVLTTLGFGEIVPVSQTARSLVVVEALVGQLYLVIIIARLVTLYAGRSRAVTPPSVGESARPAPPSAPPGS